MNKTTLLSKQMQHIAGIGMRFHLNLEEVGKYNVSEQFILEAVKLRRLLSGGADAGAMQAMSDANRDVTLVKAFLQNWKDYNNLPGYSTVLDPAEDLCEALVEFRDTIEALTQSERIYVEDTARKGRFIRNILLPSMASEQRKSPIGCLLFLIVIIFITSFLMSI